MPDWNLEEIRARLLKLSTTIVSDALDGTGIRNNAVAGVGPIWKCSAIVGPAVTVRNIPAGTGTQKHHGGFVTAQKSKPGDVIVVGNDGDIENNGWGEVVAWAAKMKGVQGTVVDGAVRDIDAFEKMEYPVYAKGIVPRTARGRMIQDGVNIRIRFCNAQVNPGDLVFADCNGIVFIPPEKVLEVVEAAEKLHQKEEEMIEQIKEGKDPLDVGAKSGYEDMLKR
ncbi:MAG: RraA family protein [Thermodesulfobacteriota bacterium]|nr:RraA family protein [Thermodesulfobacteriota bacterium]